MKSAALVFLLISALEPRAGTLVQFRFTIGTVEVELHEQDKPVTVRNFLRYVNSDRWDDAFVHRRGTTIAVVQGGGFRLDNEDPENPQPVPVDSFGEIVNEYGVGETYSNTFGTLAMARRSGQVNSATSHWFFNLADNSELDSMDEGFTVFGRVVRGSKVLTSFYNADEISVVSLGGALTELPVIGAEHTGQVGPDDLIYVDVTTLNVAVELGENGERTISWDGVEGVVNTVEYTTVFPPDWRTLETVTGEGGRRTVTDSSTDGEARFYRVTAALPETP